MGLFPPILAEKRSHSSRLEFYAYYFCLVLRDSSIMSWAALSVEKLLSHNPAWPLLIVPRFQYISRRSFAGKRLVQRPFT